jgi:5-methylcytosine-specific restriction endonuclease McrA
MTTRVCSELGCEKPLRARGLCSTHYNQTRYTPDERHVKVLMRCAFCDAECVKTATAKYATRYCSMLCRDFARQQAEGWAISCPVPDRHPSRYTPAHRPPMQIAPASRDCTWCGQAYAPRRFAHDYCDPDCKRRAKLARRKGKAVTDGHTYTWTQVMRVFVLLGRCCAYCEKPVTGDPDPDHVVPLSRGGSNGNANILPACRPCNSDKRDLLLHEWAEDRARRGKPPVRTALDPHEPAFAHLLPEVVTPLSSVA